MWQHNELEKSAAGGPNNWEQPWRCTQTLKTLAELNEQCLELLTEQALAHQRLTPANCSATGYKPSFGKKFPKHNRHKFGHFPPNAVLHCPPMWVR